MNDIRNIFNQAPWSLIATMVGWVVFGIAFYTTTTHTLSEHQHQIEHIFASREKMVDAYTIQQKQTSDLLSQMNQAITLATARNEAIVAALNKIERALDKLEDREREQERRFR